jgi:hypothetical protein
LGITVTKHTPKFHRKFCEGNFKQERKRASEENEAVEGYGDFDESMTF